MCTYCVPAADRRVTSYHMYSFAGATMTHGMVWAAQIMELYFLWRLKSEIKGSAGFVSSEVSLLGLQVAAFCCVFTWSFRVCGPLPSVSLCVLTWSFPEDNRSDWARVPSKEPHFNSPLSMPCLQRQSRLKYEGLGFQYDF